MDSKLFETTSVVQVSMVMAAKTVLKDKPAFQNMAMGQSPVVNLSILTKIDQTWVVHLPQNGTIGFDPQPHDPHRLDFKQKREG